MSLDLMQQSDLLGELEHIHSASFGWALYCCHRRREEAEEVLQTAYLKVMQGSARFNGTARLRTWFFGVIRQTAREQRRRRWMRAQVLERWIAMQPGVDSAPDPEGAASGAQSVRALRNALTGLASRQQEVLHLVFYQDLTIEEAAGIMGVSLGTARTHFERGKARLRLLLAREDGKCDGQ